MTLLGRIDYLRTSLGQRFDAAEYEELARLAAAVGAALGPGEAEPPTVTSIEPTSAALGAPDVTLHVYGTGFTPDTVILFNGGEEPTTYVVASEVTTLLRPSSAEVAVTVLVSVVGAADGVEFTFTSG